mgnify:CR=1 FL=1
MSTRDYDLPTNIPFTTASSDFQKLIKQGPDYEAKDSLINYAATDFGTIRDSLIQYMKAVYSEDYQNFTESDFGVMFTELVAYMGAVMSFKADALANENFLPTARNRRNVTKLLNLIGIRLKGPTSAGANAELVLDSAAGANVTIEAANRLFTITSPLDGGSVSYTLYKTTNGKVAPLESNTTDILLDRSDSEGNTTWTNLALLEGSLVQEVGTFDTTEVFKTIKLAQGPVIENSVQVFVTADQSLSGTYTQVDNLFSASGPGDKIFEVLYDDVYNGTVRFGDGTVGASPPNSSSYRILYRIGGGERGNLLGTTINAPVPTSEGAGTVTNTSVATGGINAETVEEAKRNGPLVFKQQDRVVTLGDYEAFVSRYSSPTGGTAIGTASTRKAYSSANIIDVFVLQKATTRQLQKATVDYKTNLISALEKKKMLTDEVVVVDGLIRTLDLIVTIYIDSALSDLEDSVKRDAANVIENYFSYNRFGFGTPFIPQDLNRKIFDLSDIRYSTIDNVSDTITVDFNEVVQLNNLTINVVGI